MQHGLTELVDATFRAGPEGVEAAFAAAQNVDLERKRKQTQATVRAAAAAALTVGAIPIPLADAGVLAPVQLGMMDRVATIYGVRVETAAIAATAATVAISAAGRSAVVGLLKLIPGVGGVISGAVASTFTLAIGYAWAVVRGEITQGRLRGIDGALDYELIRELFTTQVAVWFNKVSGGAASRGMSSLI